MTLSEPIHQHAQALPQAAQQQVTACVQSLHQRERKTLAQEMDSIIQENLEALQKLAE